LATVKAFLEKEDRLERVIFVLFSERDFEVYLKAAKT
jgi:O-acetyl-ADP-ribose deacetylase (regulator of RNase III)